MTYKPKSQLLSIEEIQLKQWYTLTISPDDEHQYFNCEPDRIIKFTNWLQHYFIHLFVAEVKVNIEISRNGRLHAHGTIRWNHSDQLLQFYLFNNHNMQSKAILEIDTIDDPETWDEYCNKQKKFKLGCIEFKPSTIRANVRQGIKYMDITNPPKQED